MDKPIESRSREKGIALIVALLVMVIMTLLGIPFLLMGETENRIAENERLSLQALYAAEAGAKMVVRWFDRPMHANNLSNPTLAVIDRTQRMIDGDGDPATAAVAADGTIVKPYYKQGVDKNADGADDVFGKPYRPTLKDTLLGTETGPDMVIDEAAGSATKAYLKSLSQGLLAAYPSTASSVQARVSRIDVYSPPYVQKGGVWKRHGIGTIKVVARIYQEFADGTEEILAERMVKVVVHEIPYNQGDLGPLHSCDNIGWNGDFTVHWGIATAVGNATLSTNHAKKSVSLPRLVPPSARVDRLYGYDSDAAWNAYYKNILEEDGYEIDDPWLRFISGGTMAAYAPSTAPQPDPFDWDSGDASTWVLTDGDIPYHPGGGGGMNPSPVASDWDGTHSNWIQMTPPGCPSFPYDTWKEIAQSGGLGVHYYTWVSGDDFQENGKGPVKSFREWTNGSPGHLHFFDTMDGVAPFDNDANGEFDNLTPEISISGGTWGVRGMIYLNAAGFLTTGVTGVSTEFRAPGEPYQDKNENGKWDVGENWVNLDYPNQLKPQGPINGRFFAKKESPGNDTYDTRGPVITDDSNMHGIFYTSGYYDARGNGVYYGSMIAFQGIAEVNPTAGTPNHYWDQSIADEFPPDEWGLPRVHISSWETDL